MLPSSAIIKLESNRIHHSCLDEGLLDIPVLRICLDVTPGNRGARVYRCSGLTSGLPWLCAALEEALSQVWCMSCGIRPVALNTCIFEHMQSLDHRNVVLISPKTLAAALRINLMSRWRQPSNFTHDRQNISILLHAICQKAYIAVLVKRNAR